MSEAPFSDRLVDAIDDLRCPVVMGLDPHLGLLPPEFRLDAESGDRTRVAAAVQAFCLQLVEVAAGLVPAVKPQVAFFERLGPPGWAALESVVARARELGLLVILDAKRGDIGSTASAYSQYLLGSSEGLGGLDSDALTVSPYLGSDSLKPFVDAVSRGKGLFVLAKTSNPASSDLQDLVVDGDPIHVRVAEMVRGLTAERGRRGFSPLGIVVGATSPEQAAALRSRFPDLLFLVPGYGAQGAGAEDVAASFDAVGRGAVVNASRSLIFAYRNPTYSDLGAGNWAEATRRETVVMRDAIRSALESRKD